MSLGDILSRLSRSDAFRAALDRLASAGPDRLRLRHFSGSTPAFLISGAPSDAVRNVLCITAEHDTATYLYSDIEQIAGGEREVLLFPPSGERPYDSEHVADPAGIFARAEVLEKLAAGTPFTIVSSVEALVERVHSARVVSELAIQVTVGDEIGLETLAESLSENGFARVEFVNAPGEFAVRGGIVDVYTHSGHYPLRIEFFGDHVDSLREFDPETQRSVSKLTNFRIVPNLSGQHAVESNRTPFFAYVPEDTLLFLFDDARFAETGNELFEKARESFRTLHTGSGALPPEQYYLSGDEIAAALDSYRAGLFGSFTGSAGEEISVDARPQPPFNAQISLLRKQISENTRNGWDSFILCDSSGQFARLEELLGEPKSSFQYRLKVESLHEGFEIPHQHLAVYTDHQIFNRYHRPTTRKRKRVFGGLSLREIRRLKPGDFVVHVDYGIGKFAGLEIITVRGKQQEAVRVLFRDEDLLYVNVNALHKLHKYKGKEGRQPALTKLGTQEWEKKKARAKKRVKDIARDLINLYAERRASQGHAFSPDSVWQRELEASFEFEDTPDQAVASDAVKQDMEEPVPMDRLVCGDVGFGKTEVAIRAAFKAVQDGRQVAVLVPTTILATQHLETFTRRLAAFPVKIDMLSRFRSTAQQKEILRQVESGSLDIVIGTHRLVSKDVKFKNLGLLIIDEEQRFGVAVKERLRKLRVNIDTLTMTATPIPRTLQFSLLGARDLSLINTPPPNRQPIETEIHTFDKNLIRDAILYEVNRGGQVFFIHNRVQSIDDMAQTLRLIVPDVRFQIAHGQMKSSELEKVMLNFMQHKFDVLVSTNIIESGLDIPNANTIIINHADRFGLAELHQLRGRVGRSDRKAFCYLMTRSIHGLTREARQRLQALEEFSDLGAGFSLAMRDMDIRGAGNMLGGEQSGFIEEIGFETYHRILDETVQELRQEEFSELFKDKVPPVKVETQLDVDEDAFIPADYVTNSVERLNIYRRISETKAVTELEELKDELRDRFGELPAEVTNLLMAAEIKGLLEQLRLARGQFKNQRLFLEFPPQSDEYFYEQMFHPLLEQLNYLDRRYVLKDTNGRLRAIVQDVPDLETAYEVAATLATLPTLTAA